MNRLIFEEKVERIYESLYSINEGLSYNDSNEFLKGFQDGIESGAKKFEANWLNKAADWAGKKVGGFQKGVSDMATDVKNKATNFVKGAEDVAGKVATGAGKVAGNIAKGATDLYNQGKDIAKKIWKNVQEFATYIYQKVSSAFNTAVTYLEKAPGKISDYLNGVYNGLVEDITSAYNTLKDKGQEFVNAITKFWNENIVANIQSAIKKVKQWFIDNADKAKNWYETNKNILAAKIAELKKSEIPKIKAAAEKAEGILAKIGSGALDVAKFIGEVAAILVLGPIVLLIVGIQKVPDLYNSMRTAVENGLDTIAENWAEAQQHFSDKRNQYASGKSDRQVNFSKDDSQLLLKKLKNPAYASFKDTISAILTKRGVAVTEGRYIKTFEGFVSKQ